MLAYHTHRHWEIGGSGDLIVLESCIKESYEYDIHIILTHPKMQKTIQKYIIYDEKELDDISITLER